MCVHIYTCLPYEVGGNPNISESENIALGRLAVLVETRPTFLPSKWEQIEAFVLTLATNICFQNSPQGLFLAWCPGILCKPHRPLSRSAFTPPFSWGLTGHFPKGVIFQNSIFSWVMFAHPLGLLQQPNLTQGSLFPLLHFHFLYKEVT